MRAMRTTFCLMVLLLSAGPVRAETSPVPPTVVHSAPSELSVSGSRSILRLEREGDWAGRSLELRIRRPGGSWSRLHFKRTGKKQWVVVLPQELVRPPGLEYTIYSIDRKGVEKPHFASQAKPYRVIIRPSEADLRHDHRLKMHKGRRSRLRAQFSQHRFGRGRPDTYKSHVDEEDRNIYSDYVNTLEVDYTYRFLKDSIYSISFGYGMVGGKMGVGFPNRAVFLDGSVNQQVLDGDQPERPGVYYGFARAYWELANLVGLEPTLIMGASYDGFEAGLGGLIRLGRVTGTNLSFSLMGITSVGLRFATEFEWQTVPRLPMSLRYELTDFPTAGRLATLASYNLRVQLRGFEIIGSAGYGTRKGYDEGGFSFTAGAAWNF